MAELVARADRAFVEEDYDEAVGLYTQALAASPSSASIYDSRAHAYLKLESYIEAVEDASKAIELDPTLGKAYLRKGVASFKLEEYEAALEAFEAGAKVAPENTQFKIWIRKCHAEIEEEQDGAAPSSASPSGNVSAQATSTSSPTSVLPTANPSTGNPTTTSQPPAPLGPAAAGSSAAPSASNPLSRAAPAAFEGKYRHQHYQMQNRVTIDVFAKNLAKDQVKVTFQPQQLTVIITEPNSDVEDYKLDVELYGEVIPDQCRYEVLKTKVEITMVKANTLQWGSLEKSDQVAAPNYSNPATPPVAGKYPSSTKAPKDWNKVESEVKEMEEKGELGDGDPLNDFFKKIFSQGDEDQRRAMMKSYVESNGTVLSTNWQEVGSKKVECTPPDGMVAKKWGQ